MTDGVREGEEIASLCVGKLRSMIEVEDDPNRKVVLNVCTHRMLTPPKSDMLRCLLSTVSLPPTRILSLYIKMRS